MGCVQTKIDLTRQLDRLRPGNYFKSSRHRPDLIDFFSPSLSLSLSLSFLVTGVQTIHCQLAHVLSVDYFFNSVGVGDMCALTRALTCSTMTGFLFVAFQADVYN